jgi:hypothetical protein
MACEFHAEANISESLCREISTLAPSNPFYSLKYAQARRLLGFEPWGLTLRRDGLLISACTAFMRSGRFSRSLDIPSLPMVPDCEAFWNGLKGICKNAGVSHLEIDSFASTAKVAIPVLSNEIGRRTRHEYILELQKDDLWRQLHRNHRQNINRARKLGLEVRRLTAAKACQAHARVIGSSMERRKNRGESVPEAGPIGSFLAFTQSGAGEIFQAVLGERVLSSGLVLMAEKGAYYQSAGTSPKGMASGASHFLVHEIASILRAESMELFNLGGTERLNEGLVRFKTGFGGSTIELEAAEFFVGSKVKRKILVVTQLLGAQSRRFLRGVPVGGLSQRKTPHAESSMEN